jgi:hypothetical protein
VIRSLNRKVKGYVSNPAGIFNCKKGTDIIFAEMILDKRVMRQKLAQIKG